MDAILLVGGFGTRLMPLTKTLPKPLIPLANVPFVERTIQGLQRQGIDHVILSLHYSPEQFMAYFASRSLGVDISFAVEEEPLGTGGAIKNCEPYLRSPRCLIFNGDIFTDLNLTEMLDAHCGTGARVTIALKRLEDASRFGVIETDADQRIRSFKEKPPVAFARDKLINAGLYIFEREIFDHFPTGACSVERDIYPVLLDHDVYFHGYEEPCYWTDLGTPRDYLQAHRDILSGTVRIPLIGQQVYPGVWFGDGVEVATDAVIRAPVLLGNGTRIGPGCRIGPRSVLGDGVHVEALAQIEDSIIWDDGHILAGSTVRGCILGRQVRVTGLAQHVVCGDCEEVSG